MAKISKECKTLRSAERYQNILYNKYESVKLIMAPRFSESGNYIWDCQHQNDKTTITAIKPRP